MFLSQKGDDVMSFSALTGTTQNWLHLAGGPQVCQRATLSLSVLAYVAGKEGLSKLSAADFRSAVSKQLNAAKTLITSWGKISSVTALHFQALDSCHYITLLYPLAKGSAKARAHPLSHDLTASSDLQYQNQRCAYTSNISKGGLLRFL